LALVLFRLRYLLMVRLFGWLGLVRAIRESACRTRGWRLFRGGEGQGRYD